MAPPEPLTSQWPPPPKGIHSPRTPISRRELPDAPSTTHPVRPRRRSGESRVKSCLMEFHSCIGSHGIPLMVLGMARSSQRAPPQFCFVRSVPPRPRGGMVTGADASHRPCAPRCRTAGTRPWGPRKPCRRRGPPHSRFARHPQRSTQLPSLPQQSPPAAWPPDTQRNAPVHRLFRHLTCRPAHRKHTRVSLLQSRLHRFQLFGTNNRNDQLHWFLFRNCSWHVLPWHRQRGEGSLAPIDCREESKGYAASARMM